MDPVEKAIKQDREFTSAILRALPGGMSVEERQRWIGDPVGLQQGLKDLLCGKEKALAKFKIPDGTIIRNIKVNRTLTNRQAVNATDRKKYVDNDVVDAMSSGTETEMEVHLVPLKRVVKASNLEDELAALGYEMIDLVAHCSMNEAEPGLADKYPNGIQEKDADGNFCYAVFDRWYGGRRVDVGQDGGDWGDYWFFPCVRKVSA